MVHYKIIERTTGLAVFRFLLRRERNLEAFNDVVGQILSGQLGNPLGIHLRADEGIEQRLTPVGPFRRGGLSLSGKARGTFPRHGYTLRPAGDGIRQI